MRRATAALVQPDSSKDPDWYAKKRMRSIETQYLFITEKLLNLIELIKANRLFPYWELLFPYRR